MVVSPFYRFFRYVHFPLRWKTWEKLPRLLTHKNEYWDGEVRLTPRPRTCDIYLDLHRWVAPPPEEKEYKTWPRLEIRPLRDEDWPELPGVFHSAFANQQPLSSWNEHAAARAARSVVEWTRLGRDGPLVRRACFVALTSEDRENGPCDQICGGAIVTLAPFGALRAVPEGGAVPHPEDASRRVVPHLDWIFVNLWLQRHGIATLLLDAIVGALRESGFQYLASTCLLDNAASLLWHWRNGFIHPRSPLSGMRVRPENSRQPLPVSDQDQ